MSFDTLSYVKKLVAVGIPQSQAEVHAEAFADIVEERLATKHDLRELELSLIIKFGTMLTASVLVICAVIKLF